MPHFRVMKQAVAAALAIVALVTFQGQAEDTAESPAFREIYEVVRTNLSGLTEAELNQAAVDGLLAKLRGRVVLVGEAGSTNPAVAGFSIFERNLAVARIGQFDARLNEELRSHFRAAMETNKLKGLVLDLRFVAGDDYAAAAATAEIFLGKDRELLDWGNGLSRSSADSAVIEVPTAVLVNRETLGAPEALAAVLRENGVALLLGNPTAGRALAGREFGLAGGRRLRVAVSPVKLGNGSEIPTEGLKPDIVISIPLERERLLAAESYGAQVVSASTTNAPGSRPARSRRLSEADLVREHRELTNQMESAPGREILPPKPAVSDPVLARALDLLKGLAVVRGNRS